MSGSTCSVILASTAANRTSPCSTSITSGISVKTSARSYSTAFRCGPWKMRSRSARFVAPTAIVGGQRRTRVTTERSPHSLESSHRPRSSVDRALPYEGRSRAFESRRGRRSVDSLGHSNNLVQAPHVVFESLWQDEHAHPRALGSSVDRVIADHQDLLRPQTQ